MRSLLVLSILLVAGVAQAKDLSPERELNFRTLGGLPKSKAVPEPASIAALSVGAMGLLRHRKKA